MRILHAVPGSVLWLLRDNAWSEANLLAQAQSHGLQNHRLVFAERAALPDHLARHRQADLFLDTWPYNAHTTASDALWAGLPVLTRCGEHYPSRVGASLLTTSGLPELITLPPKHTKNVQSNWGITHQSCTDFANIWTAPDPPIRYLTQWRRRGRWRGFTNRCTFETL